ncbi:MAG: glycine cleavage system protein H [Bacteroidetes bacterium 4572_112]|nr:MAG: glycine cleavage system protein H [Bacteroidetes bacterium 4572_112]
MNIPEDLKYTKDHEWVRVDGDIVTVGITSFATGELGDIVYIESDVIDEELGEGEPFGSIEAVKTVSEMFMPVSGTVVEFNESLEDAPESVNKDPYGEGWIIKVKMSDPSQLDNLLDVEAYKELIG